MLFENECGMILYREFLASMLVRKYVSKGDLWHIWISHLLFEHEIGMILWASFASRCWYVCMCVCMCMCMCVCVCVRVFLCSCSCSCLLVCVCVCVCVLLCVFMHRLWCRVRQCRHLFVYYIHFSIIIGIIIISPPKNLQPRTSERNTKPSSTLPPKALEMFSAGAFHVDATPEVHYLSNANNESLSTLGSCSALQCVAVRCSAMQCDAVRYRARQSKD